MIKIFERRNKQKKMKTWLLVAIVTGLLVLGGFAVVQALDTGSQETMPAETNSETSAYSSGYSCGNSGQNSGSCGGGCSAGSNCGYEGCGAVKESGSCGCGSK
jgi:hypothetical protein